MESIISYFLKNKPFTWLLLLLILGGGAIAYVKMGKLEDAPFTIKQALVVTPYPGASPSEVQTQVTDVLEESIQSLGELYYLKSENRAGLSKITVFIKKEMRADQMQEIWNKLRRKVSDVQGKLPEGAGTSIVNDDFGDVLGVFYGLSSDEHSYRELEEQAKIIKNRLRTIKDVGRVELSALQTPVIDVTISPSALATSNMTTNDIMKAFDAHNRVVDAGGITNEENRIRIQSTGNFNSLEDIANLTIVSGSGEHFVLSDIATLTESYLTPTRNLMRINGSPSIGIAVSTVADGNVVDMAKLVEQEMMSFSKTLPDDYTLNVIYDQGNESAVANEGFILNLIISVITVVAILLFFIGFKNGLLIGSGLVFSIFATLIVMLSQGIALQRMSLAAIIIAMGMLVDNAIVVSDSILVNIQRGMDKRKAILKACQSTAIPLLAATVIAVLTFLPIYYSPHITGELLSSLVIVIGVSLMFSWVFALIQTPFFVQEFVKPSPEGSQQTELFTGKIYDTFRSTLKKVVHHRFILVGSLVVMLVVSVWSFKFVPKVFMPALEKPYFTIDMWLPEGVSINETNETMAQLEAYVGSLPQVESVSAFVGQTPPRYYLSNIAFGPQANYGQLLIKAVDSKGAKEAHILLNEELPKEFPAPLIKVNKFEISPLSEAVIEGRFIGPDPAVLDSLVTLAITSMNKNPKVKDARYEWGNMAPLLTPIFDPIKAGELGITKSGMMQSLKAIEEGYPIGVYRDQEKKVPVLLKTQANSTTLDIDRLKDYPIWNGEKSAPLSQVTKDVVMDWEYPLMKTYNRQLSMSAMCGVQDGYTMAEVHSEIRSSVEEIELPPGYSFFWDAQIKDQTEAVEALVKYFPLAFLFLVLILVALFGNFRDPLLILCILPLSIIGVAIGFGVTSFPFGFFPIAGWIGLLGMIIKNVIVLIDEINVQQKAGVAPQIAIIEATVGRSKPVLMAASTTVLGMVPLLFDVAFGGMAITIIFGLTFATLLTLYVTPTLYALFYKIKLN